MPPRGINYFFQKAHPSFPPSVQLCHPDPAGHPGHLDPSSLLEAQTIPRKILQSVSR